MEDFLQLNSIAGFTIRLLISIFLGLIVGFERQWTRHPAGILTNLIVCMGSFLFTAFGMLVIADADGAISSVDLSRIPSGIVSGIGFLGAGVMIKEGLNIRGLNTAATIWATSAVGVLCCADNIWFSIIAGTAIVLCHIVFHPLSKLVTNKRYNKVDNSYVERLYSISVVVKDDAAADTREKLMLAIKNEKSLLLRNLETKDVDDDNMKIKAIISSVDKDESRIEKIITIIGVDTAVLQSGWKKIE